MKIYNLEIKDNVHEFIWELYWTILKNNLLKNNYFYSFRIDIYYRAYLRKENLMFIVFDVNNHNYEKINNKLKNM